MFSAITGDVVVSVEPTFLADQSDPVGGNFVWSYRVVIENRGRRAIQLLHRHWAITDGNGVTHEVDGPGVVGQQPVIEAGEAYEYASGCPLPTDGGIMVGSYRMIDDRGTPFDVAIPAFSLDVPDPDRRLH